VAQELVTVTNFIPRLEAAKTVNYVAVANIIPRPKAANIPT